MWCIHCLYEWSSNSANIIVDLLVKQQFKTKMIRNFKNHVFQHEGLDHDLWSWASKIKFSLLSRGKKLNWIEYKFFCLYIKRFSCANANRHTDRKYWFYTLNHLTKWKYVLNFLGYFVSESRISLFVNQKAINWWKNICSLIWKMLQMWILHFYLPMPLIGSDSSDFTSFEI